jgi:hypothetical protein
MVQLIPTLLEYLHLAAATYSVTVKMLQDVSRSTSVTMYATKTPAAPTAAATLQPTCRSNWNDNRDCSDWNWNHALMMLTYTNTTGIFTCGCCNIFSYG